MLTAEVNLKSARLDLKNAEKSYYNSVIEFLNEIGVDANPAETRITFKGSIDDAESVAGMKEKTPTKEKIDELVENSPSVRSAQTELAATKLNKTYTATSSYLPSLNLSANVSHLHVRRGKNAADGWLGHRHRVPLERPRRRPPANRSQNRQGARLRSESR